MQTETPPIEQPGLQTGMIALADLPLEILEQLVALKKGGQPLPAPILTPRQAYQARMAAAVPEMVALAKDASDYLAKTKRKIFAISKELLILKYQAYGIQKGRSKYIDEQRTHNFSNDTDTVTIGYNIIEGWASEADTGVAKINEFLHSMVKVDPGTGKEDEKVKALVDFIFDLLRKNKHGNIRVSSLIKLDNMKEKFNSPLFNDGVEILKGAFRPKKTVWFVEASTKNGINETVKIPLSLSAVPFPDDFVFEFLPKSETE